MDESSLDAGRIHALLHMEGRFLAFVRSRLGRPEVAEDILQSAYLKSLEKGSQLRSEDSVVAWFYTLLRHAIADHWRAQARESLDPESPMDAMEAPEDEDIRRSSEDCVRVALAGMRVEDVQLIQWMDLEGLEVSDAADRLDLAPKVVSQRLYRARQALRLRLQDLCRSCTATKCLYCRCPAPEDL